MKFLILLSLFFSLNAFSADVDFRCYTPPGSGQAIEVFFRNGQFSYFSGRMIDITVAKKSNNGKVQKVSGVAQGLIFAGGGSKTISVNVNLKTKKGDVIISTKTFYRQSEATHKMECVLEN